MNWWSFKLSLPLSWGGTWGLHTFCTHRLQHRLDICRFYISIYHLSCTIQSWRLLWLALWAWVVFFVFGGWMRWVWALGLAWPFGCRSCWPVSFGLNIYNIIRWWVNQHLRNWKKGSVSTGKPTKSTNSASTRYLSDSLLPNWPNSSKNAKTWIMCPWIVANCIPWKTSLISPSSPSSSSTTTSTPAHIQNRR